MAWASPPRGIAASVEVEAEGLFELAATSEGTFAIHSFSSFVRSFLPSFLPSITALVEHYYGPDTVTDHWHMVSWSSQSK